MTEIYLHIVARMADYLGLFYSAIVLLPVARLIRQWRCNPFAAQRHHTWLSSHTVRAGVALVAGPGRCPGGSGR